MDIPVIQVGHDVSEALWNDFPAFISYIETQFNDIGAVRVRPPVSWLWNTQLSEQVVSSEILYLDTVTRQSAKGTDGVCEVFTEFLHGADIETDPGISVKDFAKRVKKKSDRETASLSSMLDLETNFFKQIQKAKPLYGVRTVDGTLFRDADIPWNLNHLQSPLNAIAENVPGVTKPYLYFGTYRAFFPWHVEDLDLLSINYVHFGAPKRWYVVPPKHFESFKQKCQELAKRFQVPVSCPEFLRHKGFMAEPWKFLKPDEYAAGFHLEGEFMIVFSKAFHCGFNCGWNCAESVNFGSKLWQQNLPTVEQCHCTPESVTVDISKAMKLLNKHETTEMDVQQ